ncbi:hypothetical protein AXF42_Ash006517 [Apostasia shenzhenica]|nr:hypothetical protein AXF42_Ash006517 [Apostasia shenzhenica]
MDDIRHYLQTGELPDDRNKARRLRVKVARYVISQGQLFRRCYSLPLAKCIREEDSKIILEQIHSGDCGTHAAGRNLALQILRQGYYWPSLQKDAKEFSQRCPQCQIFSKIPRQPAAQLHPITSPWPFSIWGLDFLGPFPKSGKNLRHVLLATDYFSKWVEAKAMAQPTGTGVKNFIWTQLVCRFGVPLSLICDNGTAFTSRAVRNLCSENGINLSFASVRHSQSNGQAEASSKNFLNTMRKRIDKIGSSWAAELPAAIWGLNCTLTAAMGQTHFSLVFGGEALIPLELEVYSPRVENASTFDPPALLNWQKQNESARRFELDLLEEDRELAAFRQAEHKRRIEKYYNKHVHGRPFQQGDMVLKLKNNVGRDMTPGKLSSNWEGPFVIHKVLGPNTYKLSRHDGTLLPRTWSGNDIRKFYS